MPENVIFTLSILLGVALVCGSIWAAIRLSKKWAKDPAVQVLLAIVMSAVFSVIMLVGVVAGCAAVLFSNGNGFH